MANYSSIFAKKIPPKGSHIESDITEKTKQRQNVCLYTHISTHRLAISFSIYSTCNLTVSGKSGSLLTSLPSPPPFSMLGRFLMANL